MGFAASTVAPSRSTASQPVSAAHRLITHAVPPACRTGRRLATSWYELDSAVGPKLTSRERIRRRSAMQRVALIVGSWARPAALGGPDVPDVNDRWATSESSTASGGGGGAASRSSPHAVAPSCGPSKQT